MISKKYIIIAGAAATILVGTASLVFAENTIIGQTTNTKPITQMRGDGGQQAVLQVGPDGKVLMRGTIVSVGTTSLVVKSWGGEWTVNVSADTNLAPLTTGISQFTVGEFVGVQGIVSQSAAWTIDAKLVRNWTGKKMMMENREQNQGEKKPQVNGNSGVQQQINAILEQIKKIQAQINQQNSTTP